MIFPIRAEFVIWDAAILRYDLGCCPPMIFKGEKTIRQPLKFRGGSVEQ
jgi:hypothetical protein